MQFHVNDPMAHLWLALVYLKEEKGTQMGNQSKDICVSNGDYGELSYVLGALALHFSSQDTSNRINKILDKHNLKMQNSRVIPVKTDAGLKNALEEAMSNRLQRITGVVLGQKFGLGTDRNPIVWGERHIILIAQGEYKLDFTLWTRLFSCIIV